MHFDIVFLDTTANKYYDRNTLEKQPLGGTEATVIRVAEALAAMHLTVAVVQTRCAFFEPVMGQHCFFIHGDTLTTEDSCDHYIQIRRNTNPQLFPKSKKYLWMHDLAVADKGFTTKDLVDNGIKVIAVSRWHRKNIQSFLTDYNETISYIYNPVPDTIYGQQPKYDKNLLVWTSSPHKGLGKALELFRKIREQQPSMKLIVYNPGYLQVDHARIAQESQVYFAGTERCTNVWDTVSKALAVFYPTQWDETFGMIGSEANALGTPVASYTRGALKEVLTEEQLVEKDDEEEIIKKVLKWNKEGKLLIQGKDEFRLSKVIPEWLKLLDYSLIYR